jgi:hypothetical protein
MSAYESSASQRIMWRPPGDCDVHSGCFRVYVAPLAKRSVKGR